MYWGVCIRGTSSDDPRTSFYDNLNDAVVLTYQEIGIEPSAVLSTMIGMIRHLEVIKMPYLLSILYYFQFGIDYVTKYMHFNYLQLEENMLQNEILIDQCRNRKWMSNG